MEHVLKAKTYTIITTALDGIYSAFILVSLLVCCIFMATNEFFSITKEIFENAPNHELTGGYEIIGGLFLGFFEGMIYIFVVILIVVFVVLLLVFIVSLISGILSLKKYKQNIYAFDTDAMIKIITHGILCALIIGLQIGNKWYYSILFSIPILVIVVLSILVKCEMTRYKELNT